ncbi:MAG: hypothetical protein WAP03_23905 [Methylorubrum rhodinum]|jgi:hypothetical protein|uniref:hypothetical protein n=1 Tax=Methylorubrum rhodinum TaxID=29428 RepID=UPI003BAEB63F
MPLTEVVIWCCAAIVLLAIAIVGLFAVLAGRLPPHDQDLERLLAEMSRRKDKRT